MQSVIFLLALPSGLIEVLENKTWKPKGPPAITYLLEALSSAGEVKQVHFYVPYELRKKKLSKSIIVKIADDEVEFILLRAPEVCYFFGRRFSNFVLPFVWAFCSSILVLNNSKALYTDRGNIIGAAFVKRALDKKVILRLLGMPRNLISFYERNNIFSKLFRWSYKSQFDLVIATKDGSPAPDFLNNHMSNCKQKFVLLNGVAPVKTQSLEEMPKSKVRTIGFLGRLQEQKGPWTLLNAALKLRDIKMKIEIVGYGDELDEIRSFIQKNNLEMRVKTFAKLSQRETFKKMKNWDIFFSSNLYGKLSNSNLEAIAQGLALVHIQTEVDKKYSSDFYGKNGAIWIPENKIKKDLHRVLRSLLIDEKKLLFHQSCSQKLRKKIPSWDERIEWEVTKIQTLINSMR